MYENITCQNLYQQAYDYHYKTYNLTKALEIYNQIIETYPYSDESKYSKTQIKNIQNMSESEKEKYNINQENEENNKFNQTNQNQPINEIIQTNQIDQIYKLFETNFKTPILSTIFNIFSFLSILSGIILFFIYLPSSYQLKYTEYSFFYSILSLFSGITSCLIFSAISSIIKKLYLLEYTNNLILINITKQIK
jgi:hypothetical protein